MSKTFKKSETTSKLLLKRGYSSVKEQGNDEIETNADDDDDDTRISRLYKHSTS